MTKIRSAPNPNFELENEYPGLIVAGVDEAGRGPLAGPVVAAAVILEQGDIPNGINPNGINDSKKLSPKKREQLFDLITSNHAFGIGEASVEEIDEINILEATKLACIRAVNNLPILPSIVLIDGNMKFKDLHYKSVIKGDMISLSIAAASIIAKVHRDNIMKDLSKKYPSYLWQKNNGYGTNDHIAAIMEHGITKFHRRKFVSGLKYPQERILHV